MKALLLENIHSSAKEKLESAGIEVELLETALSESELIVKIKDFEILGLRSKTQVTKNVINAADKLLAIGAFCIGTNQIDLLSAKNNGIAVFNAPFSNTRSVVELVIGEMIILMRQVYDKSVGMHNGKWNKSAVGSNEVRGKKLGIIGYGNIGTQLSILAEALGMEVSIYDLEEKLTLGNTAQSNALEALLKESDVISLHVDGRKENKFLVGKKEFGLMKEGVVLLNLSRGEVVDLEELAINLKRGKVKGTAVDVFPVEPKSNNELFESPLQGLPNTILTPHVGGSTEEAQENIAGFVPSKLVAYLERGNTQNSVNFPELRLPPIGETHRLIHIHKNVPGIIAKINILLANYEINILGQHLKTDESIGYVITDIDKKYDAKLLEELRSIENTIRFRLLY